MPSSRSKQNMSGGAKPKPKSKSSGKGSKAGDVAKTTNNKSGKSTDPQTTTKQSSPGGDEAPKAKEPMIKEVVDDPGSGNPKMRPMFKGEGGGGDSRGGSPMFRNRRPSERRDSERSNRSDKIRIADDAVVVVDSKPSKNAAPPENVGGGNGISSTVSQSLSASSLSADAPPFVVAAAAVVPTVRRPQQQQQQQQQKRSDDRPMIKILKRGEAMPEGIGNNAEKESGRKKVAETAPPRGAPVTASKSLMVMRRDDPLPPPFPSLVPPPPPSMKHPLQHQWTLWYFYNEGRHAAWEDNQKVVKSVKSIEDFWALHNFINTPSELRMNCDYSLFKEDIKPMWEDPRNAEGGRWVINVDKYRRQDGGLDEQWLEVLLFLIGETMDEEAYGRYINGAVVSLRNKGDKIGVWLKVTDRSVIAEVGKTLKSLLNVEEPIFFEMHSDNKTKSGSMAKVLLKL